MIRAIAVALMLAGCQPSIAFSTADLPAFDRDWQIPPVTVFTVQF